MAPIEQRWKGVFPTWSGVTIACGAAIVVEVMLLDRGLMPTIAGTVLVALTGGLLATRRLLARNRQPLITVKDLRRR